MDKKTKILRIVFSITTLLLLVYIFGHSLMNANDSDNESDTVLYIVNSIIHIFNLDITLVSHIIRKSAHFIEFMVLGISFYFMYYSYKFSNLKRSILTILSGAFVAVIDELIQNFSVGRSCELRDMLIDFAGVLVSTLVLFIIFYFIDRKKKLKNDGSDQRK